MSNMIKIFLLVVMITLCVGENPTGIKFNINPTGPTVTQKAVDCLLNVVKNNFNDYGGIMVVSQVFNMSPPAFGIESEFLKTMNSLSLWSLIIIGMEDTNHEEILIRADDDIIGNNNESDVVFSNIDISKPILKAKFFVVVVENFDNFKTLIENIADLPNWNPRGKFIILYFYVFKTISEQQRFSYSVFKYLWSLNVLYSILIVPDIEDKLTMQIYSWNPYKPPEFCGYLQEKYKRPHLQNTCVKGVLKNSYQIFYDKLPYDMKGCKLRTIPVVLRPFLNDINDDDKGIEHNIIETIAQKFNFDLYYQPVNLVRGDRDIVSGAWSYGMAKLYNGTGDILIGGVYPDNVVHEDFDCSSSYLSDSYTWIVPRAQKKPPWMAFIIIFTTDTWFSVAAGYILCSIIWKILSTLCTESAYQKTYIHCFLNAWYMVLGGSAYMRPKSQTVRLFFIFFTLYTVIFITVYQTKLMDVLKNPRFETQMETVTELLASSLQWGGVEILNDIFENTSAIDAQIGEKYVVVEDLEAALENVVAKKNFSLLMSRASLRDMTSRHSGLINRNGETLYYAFESNALSIPLEFVMRKGYPQLHDFNDIIRIMKAAGIMVKFNNRFLETSTRRKVELLKNATHVKDDVNAITLDQLQGAFLVISLGYIFGTFSLAIEVMTNTDRFVSLQSNFAERCRKLVIAFNSFAINCDRKVDYRFDYCE